MEALASLVVRGYDSRAVVASDPDGKERCARVRRRVAALPPARRRAAVFFVAFSHSEDALLYSYEVGVGPFSQWLGADGGLSELSPPQDAYFGMTHRTVGPSVMVRLTAPSLAESEYEVVEDAESGQSAVMGTLQGARAVVRYAYARLGDGRVRVVGADAATGAPVEREMSPVVQ